MNIDLAKIILDPRAQPRAQIDSAIVDEYATERGEGAPFPPITVFSDGESFWLADGWHRYYAAKKMGKTAMQADVKEGTLRDAILYSLGANAAHGLRRTIVDKRRAVMQMLNDEEWVRLSNREIARRVSVSDPFVMAIRAGITANVSTAEPEEPETEEEEVEEETKPEEPEEEPTAPAKSHFNKTNDNIGWAQWSWNPVTGCEHGCDYCYARDIAMRFDGHFKPTFHENRLDAPSNTNPSMDTPAGSRVFVCSMADLFGTWVPNEWIQHVMQAVKSNPQWTYLFLTKNPRRYGSIIFPENAWIGATVDTQARVAATEKAMAKADARIKFVSCEPLLEAVVFDRPELFDWFLIGAKSEGARKVQPETKWTLDIIQQAHGAGKRVWMKDNLSLIQEQPTSLDTPLPPC